MPQHHGFDVNIAGAAEALSDPAWKKSSLGFNFVRRRREESDHNCRGNDNPRPARSNPYIRLTEHFGREVGAPGRAQHRGVHELFGYGEADLARLKEEQVI